MANLNVKVLGDYWVVGSVHSGHDLVQNMYGMYIALTEGTNHTSNLNTAIHADEQGWNRLHGTQLGFAPFTDMHSLSGILLAQETGTASEHNLIRIVRDEKDVLVHTWQTHTPNMSFAEFVESDLGYSLLASFKAEADSLDYAMTIRYEDLIESPQSVMAAVIHHLAPRWDGVKDRALDVDVLDHVIDVARIRELRPASGSTYRERVSMYGEWISPEEALAVDTWVASL